MVLLRCSKTVIWISVAAAAVILTVAVLLVVLLPKGSTPPRVTVEQGQLEGEWMEAATDDRFQFASFRGIPFAKPPTGELRFRGPRPPEKWNGIKEAKAEKDVCVQMGRGVKGISGSEDCLYLSVFTPDLPETGKKLLPVMVLIHGGAWMSGDNKISRYGPDYLLHEGVVVATLNYRVNAFGFLSLDTEEIPGNAAIKDLVAGVDWVYKNIEKFGGDPNQITIMGQSAGAGSAHWLAQLKEMKGKIQRAIIMSGSAYHNWAFNDNNLDIAQQLGQKMMKTKNHLTISQLTDLFLNSSTEDFGRAAAEFANDQRTATQPDLAFAPTREVRPEIPNGEPRIITRDAESLFINRDVPPIPTIMGNTNREWSPMLYGQFARYNETELGEVLKDLMFLIPKNIVPWKDTRTLLNLKNYDDPSLAYPDIMKQVHDEYFASTNSSCDLHCKALSYGDHVMMELDTNRWAQYRAKNYPDVPVYLYRFSLTSEINPIRISGFKAPFAGHGADLQHVMHSTGKAEDYLATSIGAVTRRRMTRMFGNFAKYGKPILQTDELLPVAWEPNTSTDSKVTLLDIDEKLTMRHEQLIGEHMDFWNDLYAQYRKRTPPRVTVEQGQLEGEWMEAATDDRFQFASFRGIPFAQPPTGALRFKGPRPPEKWNGIKEAKAEKDVCVQMGRGVKGISGSEDCLYLSVFTPDLPETGKKLLPVIVLIHGGAWIGGDNKISRFGPDYLLHEGVVVATLNYRVNAFGFLSLDTEDIPGNAAIKDLVAGFEWVHNNIEKFGGDPNQITIMGQSAGAGAAHWLAQLKQLEGKIKRAIIMSGSAYHNWAFNDNNLDIAQQLGQKMMKTTNHLTTAELTDLFLNSSTEEFGLAAGEFASDRSAASQPDLPFAPTREVRPDIPDGEPKIITRDAESFFINRDVPPIPTIMGNTNREWTPMLYGQFARYNETELGEVLKDLMFLIPKNIVPWKDTRTSLNLTNYDDPSLAYPDIMKQVHDEYFASTNSSCDLHCKALSYGDHVMMELDTNRWAQYRAKNHPDVPVYLYRFSLTSEINPIRIGEFKAPFASHGADLQHVMHSTGTAEDYMATSIGAVTRRRMTKMFGNFAKYGNPVPQTDELLTVAWEPNTSTDSKVTLLDIDKELTMRTEQLIGEHMDFWNDLYAQYRKP